MGETVIKGKRRRHVTPFSQLSTTGEIISIPELGPLGNVRSNPVHGSYDLCPYTPLIPLLYITATTFSAPIKCIYPDRVSGTLMSAFFEKEYNDSEWNKVYRKKFFEHPMRDLVWTGYSFTSTPGKEAIMKGVRQYIQEYINYDKSINIDAFRYNGFSTKYGVTNFFKNGHEAGFFSFKTYTGYVSRYSIWIRGERYYQPHIIPVIRAEDWVYQKLHMLLYNTVDLRRVIVLVDNRVDGAFPYNAFKGYYKEQLEPELKKLSCPVFKVPHEYIMQQCFVPPHQLREKNIIKRKQAIENLIDGFYSKYGDTVSDKIEIERYAIPA